MGSLFTKWRQKRSAASAIQRSRTFTASSGREYRILERFQGGMGVVLTVRESSTGGIFAAKRIRQDLLSHAVVSERFLREAFVWITLGKHPNIVQAHLVEMHSDEPILIMEYIPRDRQQRRTLRDHLDASPLSIADTLRLGIHICDGLIHAHQNFPGVAHRDIKPENILVCSSTAKLTDFGLVSALDTYEPDVAPSAAKETLETNVCLTQKGIVGTIPYMAPEQVIGNRVGRWTDIYGMGAVIYECLTGRFLHPVRTSREYLRRIVESKPQSVGSIRTDLSSRLNSIIMRSLHREPGLRYNDVEELQFIRDAFDSERAKLTGRRIVPPSGASLDAWELDNVAISFERLGLSDRASTVFASATAARQALWDDCRSIVRTTIGGAPDEAVMQQAERQASELVHRFQLHGVKDTSVAHMEAGLHLVNNRDRTMACTILGCLASHDATSQIVHALCHLDHYMALAGMGKPKAEQIDSAAELVLFVMSLVEFDSATTLYQNASAEGQERIGTIVQNISPQILDALREGRRPQEMKLGQLRVLVHVHDVFAFLRFLTTKGLQAQEIDRWSGLITTSNWNLLCRGQKIGTMTIKMIDNISWHNRDVPKAPFDAGELTWCIALSPVVITVDPGATVPLELATSLKLYEDWLPEDSEAEKAYAYCQTGGAVDQRG
jgi:serine/threonine protein kinase